LSVCDAFVASFCLRTCSYSIWHVSPGCVVGWQSPWVCCTFGRHICGLQEAPCATSGFIP
jgi:hypothetical protein